MKTIQLVLFVLMVSASSTPAEDVDFSWWDSRYANPGLFSSASGGYSRDARLPDQENIVAVNSDFTKKTNNELALVLVVPPGSDVVGPNAFTSRSQTDYGKNHAKTQTFVTGYGETEDRFYYDRRHHTAQAESLWIDHWTFSGAGLGTASVNLAARFEVDITDSPCTAAYCGQVGNPFLTREGLNKWWYRIYGHVRVFDLNIIDHLYLPDREYYDDVPREVATFEVLQQGDDSSLVSYGPLDSYPNVPNSKLKPIHASGVASFVPLTGHRYAVIGQIRMESRDGADIDAAHTLSLDKVMLGSGLRLSSAVSTNAEHLKILSATPLSAVRTVAGETTLSFPTVSGFTYSVDFKNALSTTVWSLLASREGNDKVQTVSDGDTAESARFYRLRVE